MQRIGQGGANARMILMVTGALDRRALTVQKEAPIRIESQRAHAEHGLIPVAGVAAGLHGRDSAIKIRLFR